MSIIQIRVTGIPKAQPRHRAFAQRQKGGTFRARVYDPGTAEGWKGMIAQAIAENSVKTVENPTRIDITWLFPRPQRLLRKRDPEGRIPHVSKPDRDNLDKAVMDALVQLNVLSDDCIVWDGRLTKYYVAKGEAPGAIITIHTES